MRNCFLIAVGTLASLGCDDRSANKVDPVEDGQVARTTQAAPATAPAVTANEPFEATPLGVIPFVADAPQSWAVQSGIANRIVLHGTLASGEIDVLLSTRPTITADAHALLVQELKRAASQPADGAQLNITTRDNMTIVERIERVGPSGRPPEETLVTYNVKYLLPGPSLDYLVYELNVADLSQEMFDKDGELIRKVLLGLKYDPKAAEQ